MFFDFSNSFGSIQPTFLMDELECTAVDHNLTVWIMDYLTNRPQSVRIQDCEPNMGTVQRNVLAAFLFTLYTEDFIYKSANLPPAEAPLVFR